MAERFPKPDESQLSGSQHIVRQGVEQIFSRFRGAAYEREDGKLYGPYNQLYYTPDLIQPWFAHGMAVTKQPNLTAREQELIVLATLSVIDTPYVRYAHRIIARDAGFSTETIELALNGTCEASEKGNGLADGGQSQQATHVEAAVYRLARIAAASRGPFCNEDFQQALASFDREKILAVVHFVMAYVYVCLLTNIGDGEVPATTSNSS